MGKQRTDLPLEKKIYVIRQSESGMSSRKLAKELGVGKTQITNIVRRKAEYLGMYNSENSPGVMRRKNRKTGNDDVNRVMYEWFRIARSKNLPITGPILQAKALSFAEQLGNTTFTASNGWLASFRKRHQVISLNPLYSTSTINVTPASTTTSMTINADIVPVLHTSSPVLPVVYSSAMLAGADVDVGHISGVCESYKPEDIWTMGETGLYFKAIPGTRTSDLMLEMCLGGKHAEERLTLVLCCSMTGEKEKPLLIGKSYWPRCFKNLDMSSLPAVWCSNSHAWMTSQTFEDWAKELDKKMRQQQRKILLFLHSAVCHPRVALSNIKLQFLWPDTPSHPHPLRHGVIQAVKARYRKTLLQHVTTLSCQITILEAAYWIGKAWSEVTPDTIWKCFLASGFQNVSDTISGGDRPQVIVDEVADQEAERMMSCFDDSQDWIAFVTFDDQLATHNIAEGNWEQRLVHDLFISETLDPVGDLDSEDDSASTSTSKDVDVHQLLQCLDQCREYALQKGDTYIMGHVMDLQAHLCNKSCELRTRQALLSEFLANKEHRDAESGTVGRESTPTSCIPTIIPLTSPMFKAMGQISHNPSVQASTCS